MNIKNTFYKLPRRSVLLGGAAFALSSCTPSKFQTYNGPKVTRLRMFKARRKLYLYNNNKVLKEYDFGLGFAPVGHKQFEGDGKTPEGSYIIDRRNPNSKFHLSIGISYPNEADIAYAKSQGRSPGGDIFIHGGPRRGIDPMNKRDWTAGCITVSDREIRQIYAMVEDGTPIDIYP